MFLRSLFRAFLMTIAMLVGVVLAVPGERDSSAEAAGSLRGSVCGTWVLQQVTAASQLDIKADAIDAALSQPGVTGLSLRVPWDLIDSDFAVLDRARQITAARGKSLSIRFMAGRHTPDRVFDAGAYSFLNDTNERVPKPFSNTGTPGNPVFEQNYAALTAKLATWSRANNVSLLHMAWYGYAWAEIYNDTRLQQAPGYSESAWTTGHQRLIDIAKTHSGPDLATEFSLSGHWGGNSMLANDLTDHMVNRWGSWSDQIYVQGNGLGLYNNKSTNRAIYTAKQMYDDRTSWDWSSIYQTLNTQDEQYVEVYLNNFSGTGSTELLNQARQFHTNNCTTTAPTTTPGTTTPGTTTPGTTTPGTTDVPWLSGLTATEVYWKTFKLEWNAPEGSNINAYRVYVDDDLHRWVAGDRSATWVTERAPGTTSWVVVHALRDGSVIAAGRLTVKTLSN